MRLAYRRSLPRWYDEGMASYFETLAYDPSNGQLMFGWASLSRVQVLREKGPMLPIAKLVDGAFDDTLLTSLQEARAQRNLRPPTWVQRLEPLAREGATKLAGGALGASMTCTT
jgi:hypothetical protein